MFRQIHRFGTVGLLATGVHVTVAYFADSFGGLSLQLANLSGFISAFLVSYIGHLRYTFQPQRSSDRYFFRFLVLSALSFLISSYTVYLFTETYGIDFRWALAAVAVLVPCFSFFAAKFWAFTEPP